MKRLSLFLGLAVVLVASVFLAVTMRAPGDKEIARNRAKIRLQLQWFNQAQFVGFYVAQRNGYYAEEGLTVEITPGGYGFNPIEPVVQGRADIGIATGDRVLTRGAEAYDIKALATVFSRSIACFMSKATAPIDSPQQMIGRKIGVYRGFDTENLLKALLHEHGVPESQVDIVAAGSVDAFITGELDAFPSYFINEPLIMKAKSISVKILDPQSFGIRFYSDTLFCTKAYFQQNREVVVRFMRATIRGWDFAEKRPDEALARMYEQVGHLSQDVGTHAHQQAMLTVVLNHLREHDDQPLFVMDQARWKAMESELFDCGVLNSKGHVDELCDFSLVPESQR